MAVADRLAHLLGDGTASFILINKVGAHFPIHDKFPDSHARYRPILPRGGFLDVTDTGSRTGFGGSQADWRRYRNSYRNTLEWSVGAFFDRLLERAELADALVIYTADHGQNLHEGGKGGTTTHCSVDPRPEEGAVPLVVLQGGAGALAFTPGGAASHYMIAPTLLAAMGYDREAVRARSGGALDEPSRDPATFNYLYNARLNREPRWREVDPAALAPVPDDPETGRPF
nr:sulfatase-like hydrolase/transferase [Qipengyuania citrea]